jgi:hypothetical protein
MQRIICVLATTALLAFASASHARGAPTSSFVPRGPEPHSSLSDKHHTKKSSHASGHGISRTSAHNVSSKTGGHPSHPPRSN